MVMALSAAEIVRVLLESDWEDMEAYGLDVDTEPPPRFGTGREEDDTQMASRSAFQAWERALEIGHHDPQLWAAVRGTVYEKPYREHFNLDGQLN